MHDPRGFNTFILGEAATFLTEDDPRLLLNTIVTDITWSNSSVTIENKDGTCIEADYAICTFSVGVLQSKAVEFHPPLPRWKKIAIDTFQMGIFTKIFIQFPPDQIFWDQSNEYLLYANQKRGYYPLFQPLDLQQFYPGSGILVATVVTDQSRVVEGQSDELTKSEVLAVLREMFGEENVPEPIDFMYPRWGKTPWAYGAYSNWPPGLTIEGHQNLRAPNDRLWYAGEATSRQYYGYLQGAYFEGKRAGEKVAACLQGTGDREECASTVGTPGGPDVENHYEVLNGTTSKGQVRRIRGRMNTQRVFIND